jgi:uncharacterized protein (DUF697 family)
MLSSVNEDDDNRGSHRNDHDGRRGAVGVYAAAAGLAAAMPIPFVDALLAEAARGAAMRRVSARHGVRLTREARRALSSPGKLDGGRQARVVRSVLSRVLLPLRIANRFEDAVTAFVSASLLDHYLRSADRRPGAPMAEAEAHRVRRAMDAAAVEGVLGTLKRTPEGAGYVASSLAEAFRGSDVEDRTPIERVIDAVLDVFADGPAELVAEVKARFDAALEREPRELPR